MLYFPCGRAVIRGRAENDNVRRGVRAVSSRAGGMAVLMAATVMALGWGVALPCVAQQPVASEASTQRGGLVWQRPRGPNNAMLPAGVSPSEFFALIIAPESNREGWPPLKSPVVEAEAMAELLSCSYGFEVRVLTDAAETTQEAIFVALEELPIKQNVVILFSGHGELDRGGISYWVPSNGQDSKPWTWVSHDMVRSRAKTLLMQEEVRPVLIISDSCYAGGLRREHSPSAVRATEWPKWIIEEYQRQSAQVISSGGFHPVVGDTGCFKDEHQLGFFVCALKEALSRPGREVWTARELYRELTKIMEGVTLPDGSPQVPRFGHIDDSHQGGGEFGRVGDTVLLCSSGQPMPVASGRQQSWRVSSPGE